jgi:hypothetical protein
MVRYAVDIILQRGAMGLINKEERNKYSPYQPAQQSTYDGKFPSSLFL